MSIFNSVINNNNKHRFFELNEDKLPTESERKILSVIFQHTTLAQPDIAKLTGISQQSVSRLVKSLLDRGLIHQAKRVSSGRPGQPSIAVSVNPNYTYSFGVALMTDAMTIVLMDICGNVLDELRHDMPQMSQDAVCEKLVSGFEALITKHELDKRRVFGLGVGISGYSLGGHGRFNTPPKLDEWAMIDIEDTLQERLGIPVWVENDGNAAVIGESLVGTGTHYKHFAYIYIAAGIGGGIIVNGELVRGTNGNGGEIGLLLPKSAYPLPTLELLLDILQKNGVNVTGLSDMLTRFDINWPGIDEWIQQVQQGLSQIVSALAAILDPQAIVIGGRMPQVLSRKLIPQLEIYDDDRRQSPRIKPKIIATSNPYDACAVGAAAIPFKKYFFNQS
ncbi:ROK family transcriptional regulator [Paraneptunicella aestuarii]|uniref:ROK family transcriptional regulator n=1 Tax=Paraneptunicella aestuarii TaxID=2831148 RepID=UPI001E4BF9AD|nr:ROK family transcriptional regulator [Paraneptunicella aestuarii]UAA39079.1 ROK family transcriptional regulator [Paraneptunicella aestuarii]